MNQTMPSSRRTNQAFDARFPCRCQLDVGEPPSQKDHHLWLVVFEELVVAMVLNPSTLYIVLIIVS